MQKINDIFIANTSCLIGQNRNTFSVQQGQIKSGAFSTYHDSLRVLCFYGKCTKAQDEKNQ
jgi:hypothetical protein